MKVFGPDAIRRAAGFPELVEPVARALAGFSAGLGEAPITVFAPAGDQGDVHVKSAWMPGRPVFTVKVGTWFAARRPPSGGYIVVHDATDGEPLALLRDEHHITDVRTAAAGAVAARELALADAAALAVIGTGVQAYLQALAVCAMRPIEAVTVSGRNNDAARRLCSALQARLPDAAISVAAAEQAVRRADVIVTATASRQPVLEGAWLRPGQHVTAVGADDPGKAELDVACFRRADVVVVDSRDLTPRFAGDLRAAIDQGATGIDAELGEVVSGRPGRTAPDQITVAKLIGLGVQDLAAAEAVLPLLRDGGPATPPASALDLLDA
ncbi:ornithine cyclodeaminase family protein [Actinomadura macrotermitis]|uniref:Delta(1)-pyrroline-2-carboxylate reductase n=1 Tax=Actinomadura macrotermitis TaxID=2585200 RepID=A0A7K0C0G7_9ACTN|nr:ornithine cyclodeaminase family protein [Actinomadura macrotermitis]MQY06937.1 Delta(1)-pyrroline-2-carboxylate reductase [Actinomadura macrotermitis]